MPAVLVTSLHLFASVYIPSTVVCSDNNRAFPSTAFISSVFSKPFVGYFRVVLLIRTHVDVLTFRKEYIRVYRWGAGESRCFTYVRYVSCKLAAKLSRRVYHELRPRGSSCTFRYYSPTNFIARTYQPRIHAWFVWATVLCSCLWTAFHYRSSYTSFRYFEIKRRTVIFEDGSCVFVRFEVGCSVIRRRIDRWTKIGTWNVNHFATKFSCWTSHRAKSIYIYSRADKWRQC